MLLYVMSGSHGGEDSCFGVFCCDRVWLVCCLHILYCTPPVNGGWSCGTCGRENEWGMGFWLEGLLGGLRHRLEDNIEMDQKSGRRGHKLGSFIWLKLGTSCRLL